MAAALAAGAGMVNDVHALRSPGALEVVAASRAAVCLMHMQGMPRTMQVAPRYQNVVVEVDVFLRQRAQACLAAGIGADRIVLDPGFGFGKTMEHNLQLLAGMGRITSGAFPVLIGLSRKSMLGKLTGRPVEERLAGGLALHSIGTLHGARIIRAHDVRETVDAVAVAWAVRSIQQG
jgi:dihydropteroate synthase